MNIAALKTELAKPAYSGMTDQQAADALNAKNIPIKIPIKVHDIRKYLVLSGKLVALENSTTPDAVVANRALSIFNSFDVTDPAIEAKLISILDSLITANIINNTDKTTILSLGDSMTSWAEQNGFGLVTAGDVQAGRM